MGFRMSIIDENTGEEYGDDHKLFCYYAYPEEIGNSFTYIFTHMKKQIPMFFDYDSSVDAYDIMCGLPYVKDIRLTLTEFRVFTGLYLTDLGNVRGRDTDIYKQCKEYMENLCDMSGDKLLSWG